MEEDSRKRIIEEYDDLLHCIRKLTEANQENLENGKANNKLENRDQQIINNTITRLVRLRRITLREYRDFLREYPNKDQHASNTLTSSVGK